MKTIATRRSRPEPPTLADIVREKTNDGEVIVDFYLDVVRGKLDDDGFEVCHRLEAAEQLQAIAPGLVSEYIAQLTGVECSHVLLRKRTRDLDCIPREDRAPLPSRDSARARHQALEYLASALEAPSLREDPRVAGIVRGSTDHGKTVVSFLLHVMHGVVRGFRPRQRVDAASELLGHIARDELARSGSVTPSPAPAADESSFPSSREPVPGPSLAEADPTVIPAEAGIQTAPGHGSQPADTGALAELPTNNSKLETKNPPEDYRGCYDIDRKITEAQRDPSHAIHKFVQAYDEVAATFHREDQENDNDDEVRYWISGEVVDAYGKYIWEYAPANPKGIRTKTPPQAPPPLPRTRDRAQGRERLDEASLRQDARGRHPAAQTHPDVDLTPAPPPNRAGRGSYPLYDRKGRGRPPMVSKTAEKRGRHAP